MDEYITVSAKTLDDAITDALVELGVTSDQLDYIVIEKGSAGFLGIGMKQAVIKARRKQEEPVEAAEPEAVAEEPVKEESVKEEPAKEEKRDNRKKKNKKSSHHKDHREQEEHREAAPAKEKKEVELAPVEEVTMETCRKFVQDVLEAMHMEDVQVTASVDEEGALAINMDGKDMEKAIASDDAIRSGALFGIFGGHVNVTDGRYVYMHAPAAPDNQPLYEYTLMPMHMRSPFSLSELKDIELCGGFSFLKGAKTMRIKAHDGISPDWYGTRLYDIKQDPEELSPIRSDKEEARLLTLMRDLMKENEAPSDQYERLGIPEDGEIDEGIIAGYHQMDYQGCGEIGNLTEDGRLAAAVMTYETEGEALPLIREFASKKKDKVSGQDLLSAAPQLFADGKQLSKAMKAELYI